MDDRVKRMTLIAVLSAIGAVLMILEIPFIFMAIDLSDMVVLVAFFMFSWREAFVVAILKTLVHLLFRGAVGPIAIGQISALIASLSYVVGLSLSVHALGMKNRLLISGVTITIVSIVMVAANYFFVTPVYLGISLSEARSMITPQTFDVGFVEGGYLFTIVFVFTIFNVLKGSIIMATFFAVRPAIASYLSFKYDYE